MNWTLEVVVVPVADVDRAKAFYADQLGFNVDHDTKVSEGNRIVQLTPPGSGCSIAIGEGLNDAPPGTAPSLQLVVSDINAAHDQLKANGVDVSDVDIQDWGHFVYFADPDGNKWAVQYLPNRPNG
jgi:predicted enzyme related to lactoylglutathione lyase